MTQVLERTSLSFIVGETPPPNPELYRKLLGPISETGNPDCNPLLVGSIEITDSARDLCKNYGFDSFFEPAFQLALNGRAAEGFMNVIDHQVMAARFVQAQMRLMNLPYEEEVSILTAALIHDCDTPMHKLDNALEKKETNGITQCKLDPHRMFVSEMFDHPLHDVPDIDAFDPNIVHQVRVTHLDWRDFDRWTLAEWSLRAADSSVMNDKIVPWWMRIEDLIAKKPELHEKGKEVYKGTAAFDRLGWITWKAFEMLEEHALRKNPDFLVQNGYPQRSVREICTMMAQGQIELPPPNLVNLI